MKGCDDLFISVAFITMGGIAPLLGTLKDLEKQGTRGRILTTDYLMFSDPRALDKLASLNNLDVRVFKTGENNVGFHTKGYMFHNGDNLRIIIGSSNLTQDAITKNHEWNTRLVSSTEGAYAKDIETEFNELWESSVCYEEYRDEYAYLFHHPHMILVRSFHQYSHLTYKQLFVRHFSNLQIPCHIVTNLHM